MSTVEWVGTIFAALSVWMTARQNLLCWPTGLANNVLFSFLFIHDRLYADFGLQIVYVALGIYGWYEWLYGGENRTQLPVTHTPRWVRLLVAPLLVMATVSIARSLQSAVAWMGGPPPDFLYWDSATTAGCLIAQWMLARKWLENWLLWILTNLSYIGLYGMKERYLLCALQVLFIALSVNGYRSWRRSLPT